MTTSWIEIGKYYVLSNGTEVGPIERTSPFSVFGDSHPFTVKVLGKCEVMFWDKDGISFDDNDFNIMDERDEVMTEPTKPSQWDMDLAFMYDVKAEAQAARLLFTNTDLVLAMAEEFGEVVKAILDQKQKKGVLSEEIRKECVQAAAMAMRLATEGDPCFPGYAPPVPESLKEEV